MDAGRPGRAVGTAAGRALASATGVVAAVRRSAKPLHPDGEIAEGRLVRRGSSPPTGVAWLDAPGEDDVLIRLSRAVGLPARWPDIHGLAIRVLEPGGTSMSSTQTCGDLLLASTGSGFVGRFALMASRDPATWPLTTLLPYRTPSGPLVLGARLQPSGEYVMSWARLTGPWRPFAVLRPTGLPHRPDTVGDISFDPVLQRISGLEQYPALARLREPAYTRARRSRRR